MEKEHGTPKRLSRTEITALLKGGFRYSGLLFSARFGKRVGFGSTIVVSKKVARTAVNRNRLKRRYREAVKKTLPHFPLGIVIMVGPSSKEAAFHDIEKALSELTSFIKRRV